MIATKYQSLGFCGGETQIRRDSCLEGVSKLKPIYVSSHACVLPRCNKWHARIYRENKHNKSEILQFFTSQPAGATAYIITALLGNEFLEKCDWVVCECVSWAYIAKAKPKTDRTINKSSHLLSFVSYKKLYHQTSLTASLFLWVLIHSPLTDGCPPSLQSFLFSLFLSLSLSFRHDFTYSSPKFNYSIIIFHLSNGWL